MLNLEYATGQLPKRIFTIFFIDSSVRYVSINFTTQNGLYTLKIEPKNNSNGEIECTFDNKTMNKRLWSVIEKFGNNGFQKAIFKSEFSMGLGVDVQNVTIDKGY